MISVNMHEAKTRLSELVKAVEEKNETILLKRHGAPVAEIRRIHTKGKPKLNRLKPDPKLKVTFAKGYHPAEPLQPDEIAEWMR